MSGLIKVLVTGADGFLGSNLIRQLLIRGYKPRALVYNGNVGKTLAGLDIDIVRGDVLNIDDIITAAEDCQGIIHAAALTDIWPPRSTTVRRVNIEGTCNVISVAKQLHLEKMVYVGSASSFGPGSKDAPGNETNDYSGAEYQLDYFDSKRIAQDMVLEETKKGSLPCVVVNPTLMFGPFDVKPGSGELVIRMYKREALARSAGGRNCVSVKDVSVGVVNSLEYGRIGESYILGNENLSYTELFEKIAAVLNRQIPYLFVPTFIAKFLGLCNMFYCAIVRKIPRLSYNFTKIATDEHYYSSAKAIRELDMPQTPLEIAIEEALLWFRKNDYIPTPST